MKFGKWIKYIKGLSAFQNFNAIVEVTLIINMEEIITELDYNDMASLYFFIKHKDNAYILEDLACIRKTKINTKQLILKTIDQKKKISMEDFYLKYIY